jgi:hypothetical protein
MQAVASLYTMSFNFFYTCLLGAHGGGGTANQRIPTLLFFLTFPPKTKSAAPPPPPSCRRGYVSFSLHKGKTLTETENPMNKQNATWQTKEKILCMNI